ncbi:Crp/Fnr family transcriptional regulator [Niallia sp. XMNu-256]|uniref:Crp/Fnr family transcriptional regulator n=1 Tax=Niallia sp. XMNu-256 TaxID=3082444 RepID=UPI0030CE0412
MRPTQEVYAELSHLLEPYVHHETKIEKGSFLYQEGETASELYIIHSGKVKVGKLTPDGNELTLRLCSTNDLVGELTLGCLHTKHNLNAKVLEDGKVGVIYKNDLEHHLLSDSKLALEFMKWLSTQNEITQSKLRDLVLKGKKGALYSTLIRLTNSYGLNTNDGILIDHPLTNQEIANFCGTSREVINRLLSDLRKLGVISVDKGMITVHDLDYLKIEINCENCPTHICTIE